MSGETSWYASGSTALSRITNASPAAGPSIAVPRATSRTSYAAMWLRGGASAGSASANLATASGVPCASASTPAEVLRTQPRTPVRTASEYTKGLKPTPCTTPRTLTRMVASAPATGRAPSATGSPGWRGLTRSSPSVRAAELVVVLVVELAALGTAQLVPEAGGRPGGARRSGCAPPAPRAQTRRTRDRSGGCRRRGRRPA